MILRLSLGFALISCAVWLYGYFSISHGYYWRDFWFHIILLLLPIALLTFSLWVALHPKPWRKLLGVVLFVPSFVVWLGYLLLALGGFRLH